MNHLSNPIVIGGITAGVVGLMAGYRHKGDFRERLKTGGIAAGAVAIATAAYIAFRTLAASYGQLVSGAIVGSALFTLGGIVNAIQTSDKNRSIGDTIKEIASYSLAGALCGMTVVGIVALARWIWSSLNSLELSGMAFVNGQFVPVFTFKEP